MNDFKTFFESADITERAFQSLMHVKKVVEAPPINYVWKQTDAEIKRMLTRENTSPAEYKFILATQIIPASKVWPGMHLVMMLRQNHTGQITLHTEFPENALTWKVRGAKHWVPRIYKDIISVVTQQNLGKRHIEEAERDIMTAITPHKMNRAIDIFALTSKEVMEPFAYIYEQFKSARILYALPERSPEVLIKLFREQGMDMHYLFPMAKFFKVPIEASSITDKELVGMF